MRQAYGFSLLKDDSFRRWVENLARGGEHTARVRARDLFRFLRAQGMTHESIVKTSREDKSKVEYLLMDYVTEPHRKKLSPGYIENYLKAAIFGCCSRALWKDKLR